MKEDFISPNPIEIPFSVLMTQACKHDPAKKEVGGALTKAPVTMTIGCPLNLHLLHLIETQVEHQQGLFQKFIDFCVTRKIVAGHGNILQGLVQILAEWRVTPQIIILSLNNGCC